VPLKPIFDKAPLMAMNCQPLRAGMARSESAMLQHLYALIADTSRPEMLEAAFRLACIVTARPDEEPVAVAIRSALATQQEDGSFAMSAADSVALLRASWALYEYEARKPVLEPAARWCAWAAKNWDTVLSDDGVWAAPADLLELLENLYRVTGKTAVLTLCERLSTHAMQWSSVLNTISSQRPSNRTLTKAELLTGLEQEKGSREGYYTHFVRTNRAEALADGARASTARGLYSGSATELGAARTGWERLQRHHGAICGGVTSDELLEGTSPSAAISTAAIGAWVEALCAAAVTSDQVWAWEAIERMALNAVPASMKDGKLQSFQLVNALKGVQADQKCFHAESGHEIRSLARFARGCAAITNSAVTASVNGFAVNLYLSGKYAIPVGENLLLLTMVHQDGCVTLQAHCKQDIKAVMRIRIPDWSRNVEVSVNGNEVHDELRCQGSWMTIDRTWRDGDKVSVMLERTLRVLDGHHQGKYVMRGPIVMAMPAQENEWARSFVGVSEVDGKVVAELDRVNGWKSVDGVPADIPVLPAPSGNKTESVQLVPYHAAQERISLFPGRKNA